MKKILFIILVSLLFTTGDILVASSLRTGTVIELTQANAQETIENANLPVVIDFFATWCKPCEVMAPLFEELAQELNGQYIFARVNTDEAGDLARSYGIRALPAFVVVTKEAQLGTITGSMSKDALKSRIEELVNGPQDLSQLSSEVLSERLLQALQTGTLEDIERIVEAKVDVNQPLANGLTPLAFVLLSTGMSGNKETLDIIRLLLLHGASKEITLPGNEQTVKASDLVKNMIQGWGSIIQLYEQIDLMLEDDILISSKRQCSEKECCL